MEHGLNIATGSRKGGRSYIRLLSLKDRLLFLARQFEDRFALNNFTKVTEEQLHTFFSDMRNGRISKKDGGMYKSVRDFVKDFKSFWHWHMKVQRKQGNILVDICVDLDTTKSKPRWVYLTEEQVRKLCNNAKYDRKVLMMFLFDSGIRSPTELVNVRVSDLHDNCTKLNIREETSKTFGRKINLLLCSELLEEYIREKKLRPSDYLFPISPPVVNRYLKRLATRVLGEAESPAGEKYSNLTMYDFRHSSACYWLPRYKNESALKYRFGWKKTEQIHYYTEFLGMRDTISDDDLLIDTSKTEIERRLEKSENDKKLMQEQIDTMQGQMVIIIELIERVLRRFRSAPA
ncbi:MAG: site-specific integrase [Phycisphaerales bacterium]|nr:site-specific integrase [Phycisphaerales bacterium]